MGILGSRTGVTHDLSTLEKRVQQLEHEVTALRADKARLEAHETLIEHAEQLARLGLWESNPQTGSAVWSDQTFRILGLDSGSFQPRHNSLLDFAHPEDRDEAEAAWTRALAGEGQYDAKLRMVRPDRETRVVHILGTLASDENRRTQKMYGVIQDITEDDAAAEALKASERRFRLIAEAVNDVFWLCTPDLERMLYISPAYERVWGRSCTSLYTNPASMLDAIHPQDRERVARALNEPVKGRWRQEYRIVQPDGAERWIHHRGFPIHNEQGTLILLASMATDITEQRESQEALGNVVMELKQAKAETERLMFQDPLTATANRRYLDQYLSREWRREGRAAKNISLMIADIDYFKNYNDYYGHLRGDDALARVAHTLAHEMRRPADLLVRYGGEEFLLVLPETETDGALHLAEQLRARINALRIPHAKSVTAPYLTLSIGVVTVNPTLLTPKEAIGMADEALYRAKNQGRNCVVVAKSAT